MVIKPYIYRGKIQPGDWTREFQQLELDSLGDRLSKNYIKSKMRLDKMYNFNFTYDGNNIVQCSGTQICTQEVARVFTRYYVFTEYRTDGTSPLEKADDFEELKFTLKTLSDFKLIIWSRDRGSGFFKKLKRGRPDIFSDWEVHNERIELMYKNNFHSIFYKGDPTYLHNLQYEFYRSRQN